MKCTDERQQLEVKIKKSSEKEIGPKNDVRYLTCIFLLIASLIIAIPSFLIIYKYNFFFNRKFFNMPSENINNKNFNFINETIKKINTSFNNNEKIYQKNNYSISNMLIKISYSQMLEDLILNVFFFDIEKGFYIDVGANSPNKLSVTKYFYLKGWNGINIEPLPEEYKELIKERPRDINLNICAGEKEGNITIYKGSTATTRRKDYSYFKKPMNTTMQTISKICNDYISKNKEIHFCNIDVEGGEREVLLGIDFVNYRPKIFCIESTKPGTFIFSHQQFEDILIQNNYECVYTYKINRYYVDKKLTYLIERSKYIEEVISRYFKK